MPETQNVNIRGGFDPQWHFSQLSAAGNAICAGSWGDQKEILKSVLSCI